MSNNYESFAAGGGSFSTAYGSMSGSIPGSDTVNVIMHTRTFFPNFYGAGGYQNRLCCYNVSNADYIARLKVYNSASSAHAYEIRWEYVV